ncbi:MAG TPA: hypothetical protein VKE95_09805 [Burkholderiales bacterium]|nr:hypothetical protein [Burkholderiales bacterium]
MEYTIGADPEFLRVSVSGRDTDVPPSAVCAQVFVESERLERPRILIELDQKFPLSLRSQQQLIDQLPLVGFTPDHSIALVHRTQVAQMANQYIDMLAARRNLAVRNFRDVDQAKDWLRTR